MEQKERNEIVNKLKENHTKLQHRLDALYVDKLDGVIPEKTFNKFNNIWKDQQKDILEKINSYDKADYSYKQLGA